MLYSSIRASRMPPCCLSGRRSRGFTAIELMVTIAILAILAGIAAPSFTPLMERWRVRQAAEALQSSIYYARSEAIKRGGGVAIDFSEADKGWQVINTNDNTQLQVDSTPAKITVALGGTTEDELFVDRWGMVSDTSNGTAKALNFLVKPAGKTDTDASALRLCLGLGGRIVQVKNGGSCPT